MSSFTDLLAQQADQPNSTPYTPEGDPTTWSSAYRPMGLPADPSSLTPPAGLESTLAATSALPPIAPAAQSIWDTITQDSTSAMRSVSNGAKNVYGGIKDITKTVYGDASSAVGTVFDDVAKPVEGFLWGSYWSIILAVVVIGGVVYFAGKSGALKLSASV